MKRKIELGEGEQRWQKTGGGSFQMGNRIIKPGQIFVAKPEDIPEGFRDVVVPVDGKPVKGAEKVEETVDVTKLEYTAQHRGGGKYNVVDTNGKVMNEDYLNKNGAAELIKSLTA